MGRDEKKLRQHLSSMMCKVVSKGVLRLLVGGQISYTVPIV